jgi:hypothetical protein
VIGEIQVIGIAEIDEDHSKEELEKMSKINGGIISSKVIPIKDLCDEDLEIIFKESPVWVIEHRPDWVEKYHPELIN